VVNRHKSAARIDSPDGGTGKTCLCGDMHCPSASTLRVKSQATIILPITSPNVD